MGGSPPAEGKSPKSRPEASEEFLRRLGASGAHAEAIRHAQPPRDDLRLGRICEDRGIQYVVAVDPRATVSEFIAECGPELLRDFRKGKAPRPVVGDWVWFRTSSIESNPATIHALVERRGAFTRLRPHSGEVQVLAANIDITLLLASVQQDFNPRRVERYLAATAEAGAQAVVVLGKVDLIDDREPYRRALRELVDQADIIEWSAVTLEGIDEIRRRLAPGVSAALLGSSGVGKSTLINKLIGEDMLDTSHVRRDGKGRHTTTRRQLVPLDSGGVVIDTPGIRELALHEAQEGVDATFDDVQRVAAQCRFNDCKHEREPGCAIRAAVEAGELSSQRVANFKKLKHELAASAEETARRRKRPGEPAKQGGPRAQTRRQRKRRGHDE